MSHYGNSTTGSSAWTQALNEDEGSDDEGQYEQTDSGRDASVFLIDCAPSMFEEDDNEEIPFEQAMILISEWLQSKVVSSDKDLTGVCFYSSEKQNNLNTFDHIFVLNGLEEPDVAYIKKVELMGTDRAEFIKRVGMSNEPFQFAHALWTCSNMFSSVTQKLASKRLFICTNNDDPTFNNPAFRDQARQRAVDLAELKIEIIPATFKPKNGAFNGKKFFDEILTEGLESELGGKASETIDELRNNLRRRQFKKRTMTRVPIRIGLDMEIQVGLYAMVRETKRPAPIHLQQNTNKPLKITSAYVDEGTGALLTNDQMKFYVIYGGEKVVFEKEEIGAIKKLQNPGLQLLGFKPISYLKDKYNIKPSVFLYPDDEVMQGSIRGFSALHQRMLAKGVMGICRAAPRSAAQPRFAALVPQEEILDENGQQTQPGGMELIWLPFNDDIRPLEFKGLEDKEATDEQVTAAAKVVKAFRFKNFSSSAFPNPALQHHYANLQALALEREDEVKVDDLLKMDEKAKNKYAPITQAFYDTVFPAGYTPGTVKKTAAKKRKQDDGEAGAEKKKIEIDVEELKPEYLAAAQNDTLNKKTVAQLKEFLKGVGGHVSGTKDVLIGNVKKYFNL